MVLVWVTLLAPLKPLAALLPLWVEELVVAADDVPAELWLVAAELNEPVEAEAAVALSPLAPIRWLPLKL